MTEIRRMPEQFKKNGFEFRLVERNENVGLYGTYLTGDLCGFEVVRFYLKPAHTLALGRQCPPRESITSNARFGFDGSQCYFRGQPRTAKAYFSELSAKLNREQA